MRDGRAYMRCGDAQEKRAVHQKTGACPHRALQKLACKIIVFLHLIMLLDNKSCKFVFRSTQGFNFVSIAVYTPTNEI